MPLKKIQRLRGKYKEGYIMTIAITTLFADMKGQSARLPAEARLPDEVKK